ncbi:MAG: hypothetical protein ACYCUY_10970, partial [Acidithiobacillus sp.]
PTRTLLCQTQLRLSAIQIGIEQIDAGPAGARLQFAAENQVAPEKIIQLIQQPHSIYQLDGEHRLRIRRDLPDGEARCQELLQLIDQLRI